MVEQVVKSEGKNWDTGKAHKTQYSRLDTIQQISENELTV